MTLLEKALSAPGSKHRAVTAEEAEVFAAYANRQLTASQVVAALGSRTESAIRAGLATVSLKGKP